MIFSEFEHELPADKTKPQPHLLSHPDVQQELSALRVKLLPLLSLENSIASELSGGVSVAGGKTGVFVRSGWQSLVPSTSSLIPQRRSADRSSQLGEITILIARTLALAVDDVEYLWTHEAVRQLIRGRRIRLDDSAA